MICGHYENGKQCKKPATHLLRCNYKPIPGGYDCEEHARAVLDEYTAKIHEDVNGWAGWRWDAVPVDQFGNRTQGPVLRGASYNPPLKAATLAELNESGLCLGEYLTVGDSVDDGLYWSFIEELPPACMSSRCVQMGEPFSHDSEGRPMFETLEKRDGKWIYTGIKVTPQGERCLYIT